MSTTILQDYTASQFEHGTAEASELGLVPGIAPYHLRIERKGQFYHYQFSHRETNADGETTAWVYSKVADGPYVELRILND